MKKNIKEGVYGYITRDGKIVKLYNHKRVKLKKPVVVETDKDISFDGKNYHCPVCNKFIKKNDISLGKLLCVLCSKTVYSETKETPEDVFILPNGTSCYFLDAVEEKYLATEAERWEKKAKSDEDKATLSAAMMLNLEVMRLQHMLSNKKIATEDRKRMQDSMRLSNREIQDLFKKLTGVGEDDQSAIYVLNKTIRECSDYRKKNKLLWEGIFKCNTCNKLVVVAGDFITFEKNILKELKRIREEAKKELGKKFDKDTSELLLEMIIKYLKEMSPDTYTKVFERSLDKVYE